MEAGSRTEPEPEFYKPVLIGSGSVKVLKYSNYSVQFRFALFDFEKYGSV